MPLYLEAAFYIGQSILMLYITNSALNIFFESKKVLLNQIISYSIYMLFGVLSHYLIDTAVINIILNTVIVYLLSTNYICNTKSRITIACSWAVFTMITETIASVLYAEMLQETLKHLIFDKSASFIAIIIYTLFVLILVKILGVYKGKKQLSEKTVILESLYVCVIPVCSIFMLYFFVELALLYSISSHIVIIACSLIMFINIFFFILFDRLRMSEKLKYENAILRNQDEYYMRLQENAKETYEKVRIIKHDFQYKLLYLKSKIEENDNGLQQEVMSEIDKMMEDFILDGNFEYTKNKKLNRILNYKLFSIKDIEVDIKVNIPEDTDIDEVSLYVILGNLIDNAVRNFDNSLSKQNNIVIRIIDDNENLFIKISNPYAKKLRIRNGLPLTDKSDTLSHGFGLKSVKELVESKNGYFKMDMDNDIFCLEILLFDEIKHNNNC